MEEQSAPSGKERKTSYTTSIVVMPPPNQWNQIQDVRALHDTGYVRWPPHINMAYPFLPYNKLEEGAKQLTAALRSIKPFPLRFEDFDVFEHGKSSCTVWLKPKPEPSDALHVLQQIMEREFPDCNELSHISEKGFVPHLSVANDFRTKKHSLQQVEVFKQKIQPFEFIVKEVYIISRTGFEEPFDVRYVVPLGEEASAPHFIPVPLPAEPRGIPSDNRVLIKEVHLKATEEELHALLSKALDFPIDRYSVKLLRKNKTSGRQGKNVGKAYIEVKDREQQEKVLGLNLQLREQQLVFSRANA